MTGAQQMHTDFTPTQRRALAVTTALAVIFSAYFLRHYLILIVVAAIVAYLFTPLYTRCQERFNTGIAATLTVLAVVATVIAPVSAVIFVAGLQISQMLSNIANWVQTVDLNTLGDRVIDIINQLAARIPFLDVTVTTENMRSAMVTVAQHVGQWLLQSLSNAAGGVIGVITSIIIFLYVLVSLLINKDQVIALMRRLNPMGEQVSDIYLAKMGAMVRGTVKGQFIIAFTQGVSGAASIYLGGFRDGFFIFCILLTALSVIPLGSGIITVPFGAGMMLFGNVAGGVFVVVFHIVVVTNIDNVLRPILVPREAKLDPALMLLAVFSGIAMFGFWGVVLGPVVMIIIVTTISVYLAVHQGTAMAPAAPQQAQLPQQHQRHLFSGRQFFPWLRRGRIRKK